MLELIKVAKSFREPDGSRLPILDVPLLRLDQGEQVVLIGKSGGGKTTLLHIIAGITRPDSGQVLINGVDTARLSEVGRDRFRAENIGYVFQTFNLLSGFSALENVLLGMTFSRRGADRARARDLLDRVGLAGRIHHKPGQMSVGEQQRTAVARALANRPRLLLADEPTANIDPRHQQVVIDMIRQQCQSENVTLLLVTHAMEVASQFARVERLEELNRVLSSSSADSGAAH
ncbi:MAG: ABC transporter ATP-binding protein [Pirellulales bacterium]